MFNLFQNILNASSAGKALGNTGAFSGVQNPIAPVTQAFGESNVVKKTAPIIQQAGKEISSVTKPFLDTASKAIKPIKKEFDYSKQVFGVKTKYAKDLMSLGLTAQTMDEMGFSDEEKQAVKSIYDQVGATIPGLEEQELQKQPEEVQNIYGSSITNPIQNVVGGLTAQIPSAIGNTASFLSKAGQYTPAGLLSSAIEAGVTDKSFSDVQQKKSMQAEKLAEIGQKGKEFYQKYGAYNPESTSAKAGGVITDIASTFVGPNKIAPITKLGKLATPVKIAMEGGLAGAKYGIVSEGKIDPVDVAIGAGGNLAIAGAFRGGQKLAQAVLPKSAEQKVLESIGGKTVKGIVQGKEVNIQEPTEGIIKKAVNIVRKDDPKVLTGRALTPSYSGKTPKQMLRSIGDMTDNVKNFYEQVRLGKMKGNINTLEDAANTVVSNLDEIGANIGNSVKGAEGKTSISMLTRAEMKRALTNKIEKRAGAYTSLQNFYKDTSKGLNLNDAFKAKRVYQTEIGKLIRAGDSGTDSYQALVKGVQELSDNIDNVVEKSLGSKQFIEWKKQYRLLKSIASDISKSAVVEGRRSPQTFVEQLGMLESIVDGVTNPLSTAKTLLAREIGELNTRGGAWKELIKKYDKQAIEMAKKVTPKLIKVGQQ